MPFKDDMLPFVRSMQVFGLFPTGHVEIGGFTDPVTGQNMRPNIPWQHFIYPFSLVIFAWLNWFRQLTVFGLFPLSQISALVFYMMFTVFYLVVAAVRTAIFFIHFRGNKWYKVLDYMAENDPDDTDNLTDAQRAAHPLSILIPKEKPPEPQDGEKKKKHSFLFTQLRMMCWQSTMLNVIFSTTVANIRRQNFGPLITPLSYLYQDGVGFYSGVALMCLIIAMSDSVVLFGVGLVSFVCLHLADKFNRVHKWVEGRRKLHVKELRLIKKLKNNSHQDPNVEDIRNTEEDMAISPTTFDLENLLKAHMFLLNGLHKVDRVGRAIVCGAMSFGFFGVLDNLYQTVLGTNDAVVRSCWFIWTFLCGVLLFCPLLVSAYLNLKAVRVQESLYRMPPTAFQSPKGKDPQSANLQLSLILGQFGTEPIALSFLGLFFLRNEAIMELMAALMTYFLILLDYTAGEKRGINIALTALNATETTISSTWPYFSPTPLTTTTTTTSTTTSTLTSLNISDDYL